MKKRLLVVAGTCLLAVSLSACGFFHLPDFFGSSNGNGYSYRPINSSDDSPYPSASTPSEYDTIYPISDLEPISMAKTYEDFAEHNAYPISVTPAQGNVKLLVIPVWFSDSTSFIATSSRDKVRSDIQTAYFGSASDAGWHSVKSYYETESHGALTLTGTVSEWYEPGSSYKTYRTDSEATLNLVKSATNWYFSNHSDIRRNYDADSNGYLDGVMLIYAAPDYDALGNESYDNLWAYCYWTQDYENQNVSNPVPNAYFWASYDFMYGRNDVLSRTGKTTNYYSGDTRYCNLDTHTYIHEMGHMFGLDDYYDYSGQYHPAGAFSMQDHNIGGHDPYSSLALGWGKAYIPTETMTLKLKPFAETGEMILLSPSWNSYGSPFDEYLILEYYTATGLNELDSHHAYQDGYPTGSTVSGIRLWHVDARLLYANIYTDSDFSATKITTNPDMGSQNGVTHMMSNTYWKNEEGIDDYVSPLGQSYANYNLLQLIRNNTTATYKPTDFFNKNALFGQGSYFSMADYSRQFVKTGKLNSNKDLGFSFTVERLTSEDATITINKL